MDLPDYEERIIVFIDILGFASLVQKFSTNSNLRGNLHQALKRIKNVENYPSSLIAGGQGFEVSVFSDSVVLSGKLDEFPFLISACGMLQADLLLQGVLLRGGMSSGLLVHEDGMLYGEGMLKAYRLESKAAIYPRIVIDPAICTQLNMPFCANTTLRDEDGLISIDPFKFNTVHPNAAELAAEGYCPRAEYLKKVKANLLEGKKSANTVDQRAKWTWLTAKYNSEIDRYNNDHDENLTPIPIFDERDIVNNLFDNKIDDWTVNPNTTHTN